MIKKIICVLLVISINNHLWSMMSPRAALMDISGLDKAVLLAEIYNINSRKHGYIDTTRAAYELDRTGGRIGRINSNDIGLDISGDLVDIRTFDAKHGAGAFAHILAKLRAEKQLAEFVAGKF